ncbi:MAG: class I SAM-dependent methyltransferase [Cytophagaceae bacterium]
MDPKELARQLRKPEGETGITVANNMNKGNALIINLTLSCMEIQNGDHILEIGFGNGKHIPDFVNSGNNIKYKGVDFSQTMVKEASEHNATLIDNGTVEIKYGNVSQIPFEDYSFDKVFTVNTLYFWETPKKDIKEIYRVLKNKGKAYISIRPRHIVEDLEFTKNIFTLYSREDVITLMNDAGFKNIQDAYLEEPEIEFQGRKMKFAGLCVWGEK